MKVETIAAIIVAFIVGFVIGVIVELNYYKNKKATNTPVEETNIIDSLTKVNDSIKLKIDKLDSIKDAKVIEVSTLDNDSTLKLFYKLVSE